MRYLLNVHALIALPHTGHVFHARAGKWFLSVRSSPDLKLSPAAMAAQGCAPCPNFVVRVFRGSNCPKNEAPKKPFVSAPPLSALWLHFSPLSNSLFAPFFVHTPQPYVIF